MKKSYLLKTTILSALLVSFLVITGCSGGGNAVPAAVDTPAPAVNTNVVVQLTVAGSTPYLVDGMTVSIQKGSGPVLTGVTGTNGIAIIAVTETGAYDVISVAGVDASALAEGIDVGREFVKSNPLVDPYPNLTYTVSGTTVSVVALGSDYPINTTVPFIYKVTVLKVGSYASDADGNGVVNAGTAGFSGRVMISNLSSSDTDFSMGIWSDDAKVIDLFYMLIQLQ